MFSNLRMREVLTIIFVVLIIALVVSGPDVIDIIYLGFLLVSFIIIKFSKDT